MIQEEVSFSALTFNMLSITIYRGVLDMPVTSRVLRLLESCAEKDYKTVYQTCGELSSALLSGGGMKSLKQAMAEEVLADDNIFTRLLAKGGTDNLNERLLALAKRDLSVLYLAASNTAGMVKDFLSLNSLPLWDDSPADYPLDGEWDGCISELAEFHQKNGVGQFVYCNAFLWKGNSLHPIANPDTIRLADLKGYETQKKIVVDNTLAFLDGFEANNILLYGDRGTGKSSTVKALLNEYADRKLRMIEMPKESLSELPELTARLSEIPMKFIVFIDDLSFSGNDDNFSALKAVLEGGLASSPGNVLIYATSNRRHLLRETFSDRSGDEVHHADTIQEAVSLSDRFGLFVTYLLPDKQRFLEIVSQMAKDRGLDCEQNKLLALAERWALERGARSPRYARQFISDMLAKLSRGESIDD